MAWWVAILNCSFSSSLYMYSYHIILLILIADIHIGKEVVDVLLARIALEENEKEKDASRDSASADRKEENEDENEDESKDEYNFDTFINAYSHIICLDSCMDDSYVDNYRSRFGSIADRLLIMKFDITDLIHVDQPLSSSSASASMNSNDIYYSTSTINKSDAFQSMLRTNCVHSIIHTAAVVDTRERSSVREAVMRYCIHDTVRCTVL